MKWLVCLISLCTLAIPNTSLAQTAHTGEPCKTVQTLKKEHPSQRIFYETVNQKKCYHVHTATMNQTEKDASVWVIPKGVSSFPRSSLNSSVLEYFMQPSMRGFYDNYTRGSPFGR